MPIWDQFLLSRFLNALTVDGRCHESSQPVVMDFVDIASNLQCKDVVSMSESIPSANEYLQIDTGILIMSS